MKINNSKKPNIILIVIDALRARNLGCYGASGNPSPNIDKISNASILFKNSFSCWNTTDQSLTSIFTGKYPRSHGIINHGDKVTKENLAAFQKTNTKLLAQFLKQHGYTTMAVDWMGRWFKNGFDYYGYKLKRKVIEKIPYYLFKLPAQYYKYITGHLPILKCYTPMRKTTFQDMLLGAKDVFNTFIFSFNLAKLQDAAYVTDIANGLLKNQNENPFFLFLHYWDTHTPYFCPKKYINKNEITDQKSLLLKKYEGAVQYVDSQLKLLFNQLSEKKILDDTLLIITSDHGDSLTEHEIYFDHHGLYDETTHVPLIIHYPKLFPKGKTIDSFVQHIDLLPTILDILQIDNSEDNLDGVSLIPLMKGSKWKIRDYVFFEESYVQRKAAIRGKNFKYIMALDNNGWCNYCQKIHVGQEELYDLKKDPQELSNIAPENKKLAKQMKSKLMNLIENLDNEMNKNKQQSHNLLEVDISDVEDDDDKLIKKRLKNLGYM